MRVWAALTVCMLMASALPAQDAASSLHGVVTDRAGSVYEGARVTLTMDGPPSQSRSAITDGQGRYLFDSLPPGHYKLTVSAGGFAAQALTGDISAGQSRELPAVVLLISSSTQVQVTANLYDIAQAQIELQEQQRVLGIVPNFFVSYEKNPVPLTPRQKFHLALRNEIDPVNILIDAAVAGGNQASNSPSSWGQGASGYGKRFAVAYGDDLIGTMIGSALLPSLFHQDPRYFYKGTGTTSSRFFYAVRCAVITHGDNGRPQFDYSGVLGNLAAAGISNLYYPAAERNGIGLTMRNLLVSKASAAAQNVLQEFVVRHFTSKSHQGTSSMP